MEERSRGPDQAVRQAEPRLPGRVARTAPQDLDFGGVEILTCARWHARREIASIIASAPLRRGGAAARYDQSAGFGRFEICFRRRIHGENHSCELHRQGRRARQEKFQPEVVHGHELEGNLIGIAAAMGSGVSVRIAEEIGIPEHSLKARTALRVLYAIATRVIAVSNATRDAIVKLGEAPRSKIVPIYSPVELPAFQTIARKPGEPLRIGFIETPRAESRTHSPWFGR